MPDEQRRKLLLLFVIILISLNLRPAITGVGPLIGEIRLDTGLSSSALGMLTTLPVFAFGIFSVLTALFTRKFGTEGTMVLALILLTAGILMRVVPSLLILFLGTGLLGIGIALGNVLMPGIVKREFPARVGVITGIYSATFGLGAAIASGVSIPLSESAGFGWRWALGIWAILSFVALLAWLPQLNANLPVVTRKGFRESLRQLGSSKLAWMVSLFMGVQSFTFYTLITWLPELLADRGMSASEAGWMLALMQGVGIISTFIIPAWCAKRNSQVFPIFLLVIFELISLTGLMIPTVAYTGLWVSIMGFCLGGSFGLALLVIILRTRTTDSANELSGMSQSVGYTFAATGPVLFGALYDLANAWLYPILLLVVIALLKMLSGWYVGKDVYVD